ncbi:MAG: alpha/beta hydrolase [Candidatus Lokiarchaeota archaeon]|nr:alpha/beta hydrolase [Candidatus Lokiarchaeota archaeon]
MPKAKSNSIEIEYETFGNPSDKPLLLIMGLGSQMIQWEEGFIKVLIDRGFFVITFDNRDVGLSSKCEEAGEPKLMEAFMAVQQGKDFEVPYLLDDMADDAVGLLDAINIEKAHICGASMGGMIAQTIAIRHPSRVLSLTSIMSTTGNPDLPQMTQEAAQVLFNPVPPEREAYIENLVQVGKYIYGSGFPFNEEKQRIFATRVFDRCFYPQGVERQTLAIMKDGNRKDRLSAIKVPTLVIHGRDDPLFPVEGGMDTAEAIQGSKLIIINGMGHSLPPETWIQIADAIKVNAANA